jgi:hypothetical protein
MASAITCAVGLAAGTLLGADREPELVRCTAAVRHGETRIEIVQTHGVREHSKPSPHLCRAEVNVRGPDGVLRRVYSDIDAVGDRYGVAILPDPLGPYRAVAKLGDYDGRLLLVSKGGGVVDLPGPAHYLAYDRFLVVEHHSDVYSVTIYDVTGNLEVFAADDAVLADLLGLPAVGDPPRWVELEGTVYLWPPPPEGRGGPALRLDRKHGGLLRVNLSAEDASRVQPVRFRGLEAWRDCSCGPETGRPGPRPSAPSNGPTKVP